MHEPLHHERKETVAASKGTDLLQFIGECITGGALQLLLQNFAWIYMTRIIKNACKTPTTSTLRP